MSPAPHPGRAIPQTANRPLAGGYAALAVAGILTLAACQGPTAQPQPRLAGQTRSIAGEDPSRSPYHGWRAIDRAVTEGAIEHLVVATAVGSVGHRFRTYRLMGPQDQPGELTVERTDEGVELTIRLGRFGMPELEDRVLTEIRHRLRADD
ncbi:MAG: hypothetical protein LAT64_13215 [Phycisphaerales bacterium]|nr:hypothetical protein [Planctomycetota bacterium]MCH8509714.1 hypothetical protein [Phycisphaerales bacterium]